jgi:hypothetical protein
MIINSLQGLSEIEGGRKGERVRYMERKQTEGKRNAEQANCK